ncbi:uncharacterized protein N7511_001766 [Penicillium nucicola]|uniref:uncharacterized protein n=1 Tax=Penicillium nucicola TaxID=1850975 RepID=UPI002544D6F0|nr:uncharacterized protein N7511_001766 [Penicillium nucicola]KAJ5769715.1 hypothetical protein N7511_001766 [Penicillium nucicola]
MDFKRRDHLDAIQGKSRLSAGYLDVTVAFHRRDNLKAHCAKTHARSGGRDRYVASLDKMSPDYDPEFRGPLSFDGRPL